MNKLAFKVLLVVCITILGYVWWWNGNRYVNFNGKHQVFVVSSGESSLQVAFNLKKQGIIRDPFVFFLLTLFSGKTIQPGYSIVYPAFLPEENLLQITEKKIPVTIQEGENAFSINRDIQTKGFTDYSPGWYSTFVQQEGYVAPGTYALPQKIPGEYVIEIMKSKFNENLAKASLRSTINLAGDQAVILASLIQAETTSQKDMPLVASVLYNRLTKNLPLQIKDSALYIRRTPQNPNPVLNYLLQDKSPYNTYVYTGLPISPINNPGLAALTAAFHPAQTNYLSYTKKSDGTIVFSTAPGPQINAKLLETTCFTANGCFERNTQSWRTYLCTDSGTFSWTGKNECFCNADCSIEILPARRIVK